jgi:hypothetical protein
MSSSISTWPKGMEPVSALSAVALSLEEDDDGPTEAELAAAAASLSKARALVEQRMPLLKRQWTNVLVEVSPRAEWWHTARRTNE